MLSCDISRISIKPKINSFWIVSYYLRELEHRSRLYDEGDEQVKVVEKLIFINLSKRDDPSQTSQSQSLAI